MLVNVSKHHAMYILQKSDMLTGNSDMTKQGFYVYTSNGQWQLLLNNPDLSIQLQVFVLYNCLWNFISDPETDK
jgi:hypothetical protein